MTQIEVADVRRIVAAEAAGDAVLVGAIQGRLGRGTSIVRHTTSVVEIAACGRRRCARLQHGGGLAPAGLGVGLRNTVHQQLGIGVLGVVDYMLDVPGFGHPTLIQHHDVVGDLICRGRIVGDVQDRDAVHLIELTQVLENRRSQRGVHHGDRLIGDDDLRMEHQGARHHKALPLVATELVRVAAEGLIRSQPHLL